MPDKEVIATFLSVTLIGSIIYMLYWLFTPWRSKGFFVGAIVAAIFAGFISGVMFGDTMPKLIARTIATALSALIGALAANAVNIIRSLFGEKRKRSEEEKPKRDKRVILGDDGELIHQDRERYD